MALGPDSQLFLRHAPATTTRSTHCWDTREGDRLHPVAVRRRARRRQQRLGPAVRPAGVRRAVRADHRRAPQPVVHVPGGRLLPVGRPELAVRDRADPDRAGEPARQLSRAEHGLHLGLRRRAGHLRPHAVQERAALRRRGPRPGQQLLDLRRLQPQRGLQPLDVQRPGAVRVARHPAPGRSVAAPAAAGAGELGSLRGGERALPRT